MDMKNKCKGGYDLIMEHISVTPEMEDRIVGNLQKETAKRSRPQPRTYTYWITGLAACAAILVICLAVVPMLHMQTQEPGGHVGAPLPPTSYETVEEALSALPFDACIPAELPQGYKMSACTIYYNEMLELTYASEDSEINYRTAQGNEDISGDSTEYAALDTVAADNGASVSLKGGKDGWQTAIWMNADRAYCVYSIQPLSENDMMMIVNSVQNLR